MTPMLPVAGSTPYPGMGAREVMRKVRDGYRLERPAHCHPDLYAIIQKCWLGDMNKRPDFSELRKVNSRYKPALQLCDLSNGHSLGGLETNW